MSRLRGTRHPPETKHELYHPVTLACPHFTLLQNVRLPSAGLTPSKLDNPKSAQQDTPEEAADSTILGMESNAVMPEGGLPTEQHGCDNSAIADGNRTQAVPEWLTDAKVFVLQVLKWAEEGAAKRSKRLGVEPPTRIFPQ